MIYATTNKQANAVDIFEGIFLKVSILSSYGGVTLYSHTHPYNKNSSWLL